MIWKGFYANRALDRLGISMQTDKTLSLRPLLSSCLSCKVRLAMVFPSRLLTKSTSGVLAALGGSTYSLPYVEPLIWLRPCWTALLNSLRAIQILSVISAKVPSSGLS